MVEMPGKDYKPRVVTIRTINHANDKTHTEELDLSAHDYDKGTDAVLDAVRRAVDLGLDVEVTHD